MAYSYTSSGIPVRQDACAVTGHTRTLVRRGFREWDIWGHGLAMATQGECLDAPVCLPVGSTRGAYYTHAVGGVGPQSRAFVTSASTPSTAHGDRYLPS